LIQEIKAYFKEKEYDIRKETSKYTEIQKKLESLKRDLLQATSELRMLEKNLFNPQ
jgi:transposase